jgi:hypothetical protein
MIVGRAVIAAIQVQAAGSAARPVDGEQLPVDQRAIDENYVSDLYKGTTNPNRVGTGTTADAIRAELETGQATAGKFHIQKEQDTARDLGNWHRRNPGAEPHDRLVAQSLGNELLDALGSGREGRPSCSPWGPCLALPGPASRAR